MDASSRSLVALASACTLTVLSASAAGLTGCGGPADAGAPETGRPAAGGPEGPAGSDLPPAPSPGAPDPAIRVWFKLDDRLTSGLYMGERWVSPPSFQEAAQTGAASTTEARTDAAGVAWSASDPEMVSVAPSGGGRVVITVRRAGWSSLTVGDGERSATLTVAAVHEGGAWQVTFAR